MFRALLVVLLMLVGSVAAARSLPPIGDVAPGPYRLGAGDGIRVTVYGLDVANKSYAVGDGGTISVPLVGQLAVTGKTVLEVETMLAAALRDKQLLNAPSVSVEVERYRQFFILGEVQKPGQYPYVPGMSVLTAVSIAGGYTFRAQTKRATIVRNLDGRTIKGGAVPETLVQPGDTISIAEAWF
jgi:polysaccharide export outer membrane protein